MTNIQKEIREELTKQEWVQKYLEDILGDAWRKGAHKEGIDVTEEADKARLHLTKWGVVIKVGDSLFEMESKNSFQPLSIDVIFEEGVNSFSCDIQNRWTKPTNRVTIAAVEPLIEER